MRTAIIVLLVIFGCVSCGTEPVDELEPEGLDPAGDEDGDGLSNGEEESLGTDPAVADSDNDGYTDFEEVDAETDPLDSSSVIYIGGWPYNPNKDSITDPGWLTPAVEGGMVPNFTAVDQHGEMVQLYDFAGHGKEVILDMGTPWCGPCKAMAAYLSTGDMEQLVWNEEGEYYPWWKVEYDDLYRMVQDEDIYWITVLFSESVSSGPTDQSDCEDWEAAFPNEHVPVLADSELDMMTFLDIQSYPAISVVDSDMKLIVYSPSGPYYALRHLFPE
jgi:thiol-disulfide isomerase/thioredoxin